MAIQRVSSGILEFDDLIEGGFPSDSMILLIGHPGTGKTTFSSQFLYNRAKKFNEKGIYACFSETKRIFMENMLMFGWDFERLERERLVSVLDLSVTRETGLQSNLDAIMKKMTQLRANRLVVDSFSAISMALKESIDIRVMTHLLYKFLKKAKCISILVVDQPWGSPYLSEGISEFIADGIIHFESYFDNEDKFRRRLRILKMRGTNHSNLPREYEISLEGLQIIEN